MSFPRPILRKAQEQPRPGIPVATRAVCQSASSDSCDSGRLAALARDQLCGLGDSIAYAGVGVVSESLQHLVTMAFVTLNVTEVRQNTTAPEPPVMVGRVQVDGGVELGKRLGEGPEARDVRCPLRVRLGVTRICFERLLASRQRRL